MSRNIKSAQTDAPSSDDELGLDARDLRTPEYVADWLGVDVRVLGRWRMQGCGPLFVSLSTKAVRYLDEDVRAFIAARRFANTAAAGQAGRP